MPEPASSFMVGNAPYPASYAAPLLNFDKLAELPDAYFKGTQQARTLALQNAFPNGLPTDDNGNLDVNAISGTLAKLGGADYAKGLMPYLIEQQMGRAGASAINEGEGDNSQPPTARPSTNVVGASGPANIRGPAPASQANPSGGASATAPTSSSPTVQPQLSSAGTDNNGADTVRSIATELAGGRDLPPQVIPNIAKAFKVDPDAPLSPAQADAIRNRLPTAISGAGPAPQQGGQGTSQVTGAGAPVNPVGGTGGGGAPAPSALPETPPQGQPPIATSPGTQPALSQQPGQQPMAVPGVPAGQDAAAVANRMIDQARQLHALAAQFAAMQGGQAESQAIENRAKVLEDRAKQIFDYMGTAMQPTPEQKNIASGAASTGPAIAANVKNSETQMAGIRGSASEYEGENGLQPKVQLAQAILNDPRVYTGTGGDISQMLNRAAAVYGPTAPAQLQEMLSKVTAGSILAQINGLKTSMMEAGGAGSSAGRIFQTQVELMQKASPQLGTTLAGNRALVELERRIGEQSIAVRNLALDYLGPPDANGVPTKHKFLDAGFDKTLSTYLQGHALFTKDEMADPSLLGAPTAPPVRNKAQAQAWIGGMGLKPGDPYRLPGGKLTMVPRITRITVPLTPANARPGSAQAAPAPQQ